MLIQALLACHPAVSDSSGSTPGDSDVVADSDPSTVATGATIGALVGINGFIDDPLDRLAAFGNVREYHNWDWNDQSGPAYPDERYQFSLWGGFWDFDAYYRTLHDAGTDVTPALQGSVSSLGWAVPPVPQGADREDPASYAAHASYVFQLAARYGSVVHDDAELKLADGQVRVSGLGYLAAIEDGNETDANWTTGDGSYLFEPGEYAAMAAADQDALRAADPGMKLVMAGLAGAGPGDWTANVTRYWDGMQAWADAHRGGEFPADILNVHTYCFGPDGFGVPDPRPARSPEDCGLAAQLATADAWRDAHLPDRPLWLTEFGYDTDPGSNLRAPAFGAKSAEDVQADWLVRSVLAIAEAGFDRADVFVSRDACSTPDCEGHDVQFTTSGVLREPGDFTPKVAFWYLATLRHALDGMRFAGVVDGGEVRVDAFAGDAGGAYVLWLPTSEDAHRSYTLAVPGAEDAVAVRLVAGSAVGEEEELGIDAGTVTADVGETPIIVKVDRME
jgi:hypothetical protein